MSSAALDANATPAAPSGYGRLMRDRGFVALMVAQFLGALNDNLLKTAIVMAATATSALPKLWQPKPADVRRLGELPTLGSGKLDLRKIKTIAAGAG